MRMAHRMRDQDVYRVIIDVSAKPNCRSMSCGRTRCPIAMKRRCGHTCRSRSIWWIEPVRCSSSPLLEVEPIERRMHELLEYAPLVRARIHRLGEADEILNSTFRDQYEALLECLASRARSRPTISWC